MRLVCAVLLLLLGVSASPAAALTIERVTIGPQGGNADVYTEALELSASGDRVVFASDEPLAPDDTRYGTDLFARGAAGTETLTREYHGPWYFDPPVRARAYFVAASDDATRVLLRSIGRYAEGDTDTAEDGFVSAGGDTVWWTRGPSGGNEEHMDASPVALAADGSRVVFESGENLTGDDVDYKDVDVFVRAGGATVKASAGNGDFDARFAGASADATRVVYATNERVTADDRDDRRDLYLWRADGGPPVKLTPGDGPFDVGFDALSRDGGTLVFHTVERLGPSDADERSDLYAVTDAALRHVSPGNHPEHGVGYEENRLNGEFRTLSEDGARVFFTSYERLTADDTDAQLDSFVHPDLARVSSGPAGGNGEHDAEGWGLSGYLVWASADGARAVFSSLERLTADDADDELDFFEWHAGTVRRVTAGAPGDQVPPPRPCPALRDDGCPRFAGGSRDGTRLFFVTLDRLAPEDTDDAYDAYERAGGVTTLLSPPRPGRAGDFDVRIVDIADDGGRVLLETRESLTPDDTDTAPDGYVVTPPPPSGQGGPGGGPTPGEGDAGGGDTGGRARVRPAPPGVLARGPVRTRRRGRRIVSLAGWRTRGGVPLALAESGLRLQVALRGSAPGRRVGRRCRPPARRLARRPPCRRTVRVTRRPLLLPARPAGRVKLHLGRRLRLGRYGATLRVRDPAGRTSAPVRVAIRLRR